MKSKFIIGHNVKFDINVIGCEFYRKKIISNLDTVDILDTCSESTAELCKLPGGRGGKFKLPTLTELYNFLFFRQPLKMLTMQALMLKLQLVVF